MVEVDEFVCLQIVQSFFHADGVGLPLERLQQGLYKVISADRPVLTVIH